MHIENGDAFGQVGQVDVDLTVETSGAQQRLVEHIDAVGGRNINAAVGILMVFQNRHQSTADCQAGAVQSMTKPVLSL